jgi:hypothetical protein
MEPIEKINSGRKVGIGGLDSRLLISSFPVAIDYNLGCFKSVYKI